MALIDIANMTEKDLVPVVRISRLSGFARIDRQTIYRHLKKAKIMPAFMDEGPIWRSLYRLEDILAWIETLKKEQGK